MAATNFKEATFFKKAFGLAMGIFRISKKFSKEETYSLTDQIRRSSRSVCANIAEAYRIGKLLSHIMSNPEKY